MNALQKQNGGINPNETSSQSYQTHSFQNYSSSINSNDHSLSPMKQISMSLYQLQKISKSIINHILLKM